MESTAPSRPAEAGAAPRHGRRPRLLCSLLAVALLGTAWSTPSRAGESAARAPVVARRPGEPAQALYKLEYKFRPGQSVYYQMEQKGRITTQKNETTETVHNSSTTLKHFQVKSVSAEGVAVLESFLDRVKMSHRFDDGPTVTFDSESKKAPPRGFAEIRNSIGRALSHAQVDKTGRLVSVTSLLGSPDDENASSDEPVRNLLVVLPDRPVAVGTRWTEEFPVKVKISKRLTNKVTLLRKYELKSVENNLATIRMKTEILTPIDDPGILGQLILRTPQGTIVFDIDRGLIASRSLTTNKTEIGVIGSNSAMRAAGELTERIVAPPTVTSNAAAQEASQTTRIE